MLSNGQEIEQSSLNKLIFCPMCKKYVASRQNLQDLVKVPIDLSRVKKVCAKCRSSCWKPTETTLRTDGLVERQRKDDYLYD